MLININEIKVNDRIRKEFGNIDELAQDIKNNGLINPPVVTPDNELIAGERRLRACKSLGYQQIEVRVMSVKDSEHQLKIEISENENRKEFTFSERIDWAKRLERVEKIKADERMKEGNNQYSPVQNSSQGLEKGKARDIVANQSGFGSHDTYSKAKFISENADEEMIKKLDDGKLSINGAYQRLKSEKEGLELKLKELENKKAEIVDNTDYRTIDNLKNEIKNTNTKISNLQTDANDYKNKYLKTLDQLENEQKKVSKFMGSSTNFELISSTSELTLKMINFLKEMSKYDYLSETFNELPDVTRKEYVRSIYGVYKWARNILNQVKHDDVIGVNKNTIEINNFKEDFINE